MEPLPNRRGNEDIGESNASGKTELQWSPFRIEGETKDEKKGKKSKKELQWSPFRIEGETQASHDEEMPAGLGFNGAPSE